MKPSYACWLIVLLGASVVAQVAGSAAGRPGRAVIEGLVTKEPGSEPVKKALIELIAESDLKIVADECSLTERRAAEAERELVEWKKAKFMEEHVGKEFDGLIISAQRFGLFVELTEMFVEGLLPIDTLPGDHYMYHENVRKIIGQRTRREFSIGDPVRVILDRVDPLERKLQFALVEPERHTNKKSRHKKAR